MAFRPSLDGLSLEDRVLLSGRTSARAAVVAARTQVTRTKPSRSELISAYRDQLKAAGSQLKQYMETQVDSLYVKGRPGATQLAGSQKQVVGAVDATAFRVSSQLALLPDTGRVVAQVQKSQLGSNPASLVTRIDHSLTNPRLNRSATSLTEAIDRAIDDNTALNITLVGRFLRSAPIYRLSVADSSRQGTGVTPPAQQIPIQQFMAQQMMSQADHIVRSLPAIFPNVADAAISNNGSISADLAVEQAFANELLAAMELAVNQLGNSLEVFPIGIPLFPGAATSFVTPFSPVFFGFPTTDIFPTSLLSALAVVPTTSTEFFPVVNTTFTNTFQNVGTMLNPFFGLPTITSGITTLPTSPFTTASTPTFSNFGAGFNYGLGSEFIGFGTAPIGVSTNLATGFNGLVGINNSSIGFATPAFSGFGLSSGTGLGVV